jgi:hypothetical protein
LSVFLPEKVDGLEVFDSESILEVGVFIAESRKEFCATLLVSKYHHITAYQSNTPLNITLPAHYAAVPIQNTGERHHK